MSPAALEALEIKSLSKEIETTPLEPNYHLVIGANILSDVAVLENLAAGVKAGGFLLSEARKVAQNDTSYQKLGLELVSVQQTEDTTFVLLRKVVRLHLFLLPVSFFFFKLADKTK